MLKIVDLKKSYHLDRGNVAALRGVSFEIPEGQFFTLLGPSGSGKSTAMRCVAGLEHPESGEIYIDDLCVYSSAKGIRIPPDERPIGMVFQSYAIWPHMTVEENVAFPLKARKFASSEIKPRVAKVLDLVGDLSLVGRPVHAHIRACRSGHRLNGALAARLAAA